MLHDISVAVREGTPEWPGDTPYSCRWTWEIARGASVNLTAIAGSPHVGTHADAPLHVRDGGAAADDLPLEPFLGPARVVALAGEPRDVGIDELMPFLDARVPERLLLSTGRSIASGAFPDDWPALSEECVRQLAASGMRLLGVDTPSVDRRASTALAVHHALFAAGACNIENLDLRGIEPGAYELFALPQRLVGTDAAPVRAVLRST